MKDRVGQQLGNYRLVRLLGQGGFADVYLGEHVHLGSQAAVKVLHAHLVQEDWERFRKEARIIASLVHPHIVRLLDFDVEDGTPFLVMSYAPNGTLRRRHASGTPLAPGVIVPYVRQVASALQYVHEHRLIHRDVKPENLLLGAEDEVLLGDFGVAMIAQSVQQSDEMIGGTVAYMAPEQIQSKPCAASDQYALGVVVYEWLAGARPFDGSFTEVAAKQLLAPPPPLRAQVPTLSPAIEAVVLRALAKDPQGRFPDVQAFARALEAASGSDSMALLIDGASAADVSTFSTFSISTISTASDARVPEDDPLTTRVLPPEPPSGFIHLAPTEPLAPRRQGISRRVMLTGLAGLAGVAAAGGALTWLALARKPAGIPTQTTRPSATPSPTPLPALGTTLFSYHGHNSPVYAVAWSPDGMHIASGSGTADLPGGHPDPRGDFTAQVWDARTGAPLQTYRGHIDSINAIAWSPDGTKIASASYDRTVQVWDARTATLRFAYHGHSDHVWAVAWSPDGTRIASAGKDGTVQIWKVGSQAPLFVYRGHHDGVSSVAWSPKQALIASGSHDRTVQVWAIGDQTPRYIYSGHRDQVNALAWSPDGTHIASGSGSPGQHIDTTVHIWQPFTAGPTIIYTGHQDQVNTVSWSPDGTRIASGGGNTEEGYPVGDKLVHIWDASTGRLIYAYNGHYSVVESLDWSPDGTRIVSGSDDHTAQVWWAT